MSDRSVKTEANRHVLRVVRDLADGEQEWEFFCECGHKDCDEPVFLTLDAYVELREQGGVVLADGHQLSQAERARGLRADAEALRREATHQVRRTMKNLRHSRRR